MAVKIADHVVGRPGELGPEVLALRGDPGRAGVEMALAGHVAADRDERRRPERELLGAEQRGHEQVPPGLQPAIGAQRDAIAQVVAQQVWWTSARPSSHGAPTCLIDDSGDAPVPPAWPDRWMYEAPALATPAAIVPTPRPATSLTPMRADGLIARRSAMSWARSSIE